MGHQRLNSACMFASHLVLVRMSNSELQQMVKAFRDTCIK